MEFFNNPELIRNLNTVLGIAFLTFVISFLLTPLVGRLSQYVGAIDLPAKLRQKTERGYSTRLHSNPYPKLGGLAMFFAMVIVGVLIVIFSNEFRNISNYSGVILGILIIVVLGFLDDVYEISGATQLLFQFLAAFMVVLSGVSINSVSILGIGINFNWFSTIIDIGGLSQVITFPGSIITILWIVGLINVINWVSGVDALNGVVSSIASFTMLLLVLATGNISLAVLIAIHLGAILGVLPFNYNPGKIMYGSIGDYLNGYLLAVFAILGGARWSATIILLALPILDGLYVVITRLRDYPETRKSVTKLLSISGYNHLHHRLLASGYSKKMVVFIEGSIMLLISVSVLLFSDIRQEYLVMITGIGIIFALFILVTVQMRRAEKQRKLKTAAQVVEEELKGTAAKDVVIKMKIKDEKDEEKDEKFIY
ncbi:MAG: MraY family glycosyltransferase [Candidatus Dojkabacteria bacterium]